MEIDKIRKKVKEKLSERRYTHTLGVEEVSVFLAKKYGEDEEKTRVAAILHDYMKEEKKDILKDICEGISEVVGYENLNEILHGFAGAIIAKKEFLIDDEDTLNAIKYHTVGRKNMSILEKIIYISDAIEEGRDYPGVDKIREKTVKNINEGIIFEVERKLEFLKSKNGVIHRNTLEMLESLKEEINEHRI